MSVARSTLGASDAAKRPGEVVSLLRDRATFSNAEVVRAAVRVQRNPNATPDQKQEAAELINDVIDSFRKEGRS